MTRLSAQKILRYQQTDDWCGPAVIQMALAAGGIRRSQKEIAKDVIHKWWGTTQQAILAYLSRYFDRLNFKEKANLANVSYHLKKGHIVIVNWWDDIDPEEEEGHYSLILGVGKKRITLADPSQNRGIWQMRRRYFITRWYDSIDVNWKKWIEGWMLWVDPKSRINLPH